MIPDDDLDTKDYCATGGGEFGTELLKILGLEGRPVTDINIYVSANDVVYATATFRVLKEQGRQILGAMVGMEFKERSE